MDVGLFNMPSHPPERSLFDGQQWDLQILRWADEYGFSEAWIGEHFTSPWEPNPTPDIQIAQALLQTQRIKLAPGAHLLPYHNPAELACRVAFLDHLAQGRFMFGIGASGLPSDWKLFNVDGLQHVASIQPYVSFYRSLNRGGASGGFLQGFVASNTPFNCADSTFLFADLAYGYIIRRSSPPICARPESPKPCCRRARTSPCAPCQSASV